ncbi:protein DEHYDRATION-INDUCED 19 homolog 3-like [Abrus precatorius]|uniref:Protein DEHYDRATION-INDUCED 19 homolog 3-like n=1 Tax=Abrus precatorius TaxID=3816 RepID=A0A8B8K2R5_ABRPR|nr:protein DEHYDRATION-INDUCED 19 homolog 3-like [Abrus precatorius]
MTKEGDSANDHPEVGSFGVHLDRLKLELSYINQGIQSYILGQRINGNWGAERYDVEEEVDEKTQSDYPDYDGESYSVINYTDEEDNAQSLIQCPFCDFEIDFSLEEMHYYDPQNMLCPMCDEELGEDAIRVAQHSSSWKQTWKSDKSSVSSDNSVVLDKKLHARGSKHEPMPDPILPPNVCDASVPNSSSFHPGEGSSYNTSDISNAKSTGTDAAPDMVGDAQDNEERKMRACFVQELVLSTLF